jgi:GDP-D-mannose 3',5'-epimerase
VLLLVWLQVLSSTTEIEMWGDGKQTRSFTFIDDCVEGILRVTKSDYREPLNLGSDEMVSMNEMMQMAMSFEGKVGGSVICYVTRCVHCCLV